MTKMNSTLNYTIPRPNIINQDINLVDYVSINSNSNKEWFSFLNENFKLSSEESYRKRNLSVTVIYSTNRINNFPINSYEDQLIDNLNKKIIITKDNNLRYNFFIDPYNVKHLIVEFDSNEIMNMHNYFLNQGANWLFGQFKPHVVLESKTTYTEEDFRSFPNVNELCKFLTFELITFSRFGECKN